MDLTAVDASKQIAVLVSAIGAVGALGMAAFGLVDATKAISGGVSNVGYRDLEHVLTRFAAALGRALGGDEWKAVVHAHWINGRPRGEQKAIVKSLIRLGLVPETADSLARAGHVDPAALARVATKLRDGEPLLEADVNVLGRLDASVEAYIDAAFDRADQRYRNVSRLLAGFFAVALALLATWAAGWTDYALAVVVGLAAVPLAPVAKDLASSLASASQAMKAARRLP
jgi:hypothetical protein